MLPANRVAGFILSTKERGRSRKPVKNKEQRMKGKKEELRGASEGEERIAYREI